MALFHCVAACRYASVDIHDTLLSPHSILSFAQEAFTSHDHKFSMYKYHFNTINDSQPHLLRHREPRLLPIVPMHSNLLHTCSTPAASIITAACSQCFHAHCQC